MSTIGVGHADRPGSRAVSVSSPNYPAGTIPDVGLLALGSAYPNQTNANKYILLALPDSQTATNPGLKITYNSGSQAFASLISPSQASARSLGALLHDSLGNEIFYGAGGSGLLVDPSHSGWQSACLSAARSFLSANPDFAGCYFDNFIDDILGFGVTTYPVYSQSNVVKFSNATQYADAQISFSQAVHAALKSDGYFVGVNGRSNSSDIAIAKPWMQRYLSYVTAVMIEFWMQRTTTDGDHYLQDGIAFSSWNEWIDLMKTAADSSVGFIPNIAVDPAAINRKTIRYMRASYILNWNGIPPTYARQASGAILFGNVSAGDIWNTDFTQDLGLPIAAKQALNAADGNNAQVWMRDCSKGYAIVNPTTGSKTVTAHGTNYTIASGDAVLVVT